ncbi:unnamed protein product, partial [Discosporangium mesarthrocarpum]
LLRQHEFLNIGLNGKVHCSLTGHDIPARVDAIQQHLGSKKLKKHKEWYSTDFSKYLPYITAHKSDPKLLFCHLTKMELNRIPSQVEAHVNGKRYKNRLREREEAKASRGERDGSKDKEVDFWMPNSLEDDLEHLEEEDSSDEEEDPMSEEEEEEEEEDEDGDEELGAEPTENVSLKVSSMKGVGKDKDKGKVGRGETKSIQNDGNSSHVEVQSRGKGDAKSAGKRTGREKGKRVGMSGGVGGGGGGVDKVSSSVSLPNGGAAKLPAVSGGGAPQADVFEGANASKETEKWKVIKKAKLTQKKSKGEHNGNGISAETQGSISAAAGETGPSPGRGVTGRGGEGGRKKGKQFSKDKGGRSNGVQSKREARGDEGECRTLEGNGKGVTAPKAPARETKDGSFKSKAETS